MPTDKKAIDTIKKRKARNKRALLFEGYDLTFKTADPSNRHTPQIFYFSL